MPPVVRRLWAAWGHLNNAQALLVALGTVISAVLGFFGIRMSVADSTVDLVTLLSAALLAIGVGSVFLIALLLFAARVGWLPPIERHVHHVTLGAAVSSTATLETKVIRASESAAQPSEPVESYTVFGYFHRAAGDLFYSVCSGPHDGEHCRGTHTDVPIPGGMSERQARPYAIERAKAMRRTPLAPLSAADASHEAMPKIDYRFTKQEPFSGGYLLTQLWFYNDAPTPSATAVARDVTATISYVAKHDAQAWHAIPDYLGQWVKDNLPADMGPLGQNLDNLTATKDILPNDLPAKLVVALKYPDDPDCYLFYREGIVGGRGDGRVPSHRLALGKHEIWVTLRGVGVHRRFVFDLENLSDALHMTLRPDAR